MFPIPIPDLGQAIFAAFSAAMTNLGNQIMSLYQQMVQFFAGNAVIFSTGDMLSDHQPVVMMFWQTNVMIADATLALVLMWIGYNVIFGVYRPLEMLSRVVLGALASHASLQFIDLLRQINNALSLSVLTFSPHPQPGDIVGTIGFVAGGQVGQVTLQVVILVIMAILISVQMLVRLGLLDLLIGIAPLAMILYISPSTQRWGHLWMGAFLTTLFVQFLQVSVIALGGALIVSFGQTFSFVSVLAGISLLVLTLRVPRWLGSAVTSSLGEVRVSEIISSISTGLQYAARIAALIP